MLNMFFSPDDYGRIDYSEGPVLLSMASASL
jgi:hypothetical protein